MKKTTLLFTALITLVLFAVVGGCKRSDDARYGTVTFWNDDPNISDIIVTIDDYSTDRITQTTYNTPFCNSSGNANFYLQEGYHTWSARTVNGTYLGSQGFNLYGSCTTIYIN